MKSEFPFYLHWAAVMFSILKAISKAIKRGASLLSNFKATCQERSSLL